MSRVIATRANRAEGRRTVSVSLPWGVFCDVSDASADAGESVSGFLAKAGAERAARLAKRAAAQDRAA